MIMESILTLSLLSQIPPPPAPKSVNSVINWTQPATNVDGTPLTDLKGYQFLVAPDGVDISVAPPLQTMNVENLADVCPGDPCEVSAVDLFSGLQPGTYRVWAKAYDQAGNLSPLSQPSPAFLLDPTPPLPPSNIQVNVKVLIEIRVPQ